MGSIIKECEEHIVENDPPTEKEVELLEKVRELLSDVNLNEKDKEDKNLVRFLRARNANVNETQLMIRNDYHWRLNEGINSLLHDYKCLKGWKENFCYQVTGFDRTGSPVLVLPFGKWDIQKEVAYGKKDEFVKFQCFRIEQLMSLLMTLSKNENHMKKYVAVADLEGLSFRQVSSMDVIDVTIRTLKIFETHYPETVKTIVILNAPWPFQIIWKIVKPFISERTHSRLFFVGGTKEKWREALLKLCEPDQFPYKYGGTAPDTTEFYIGRDGTWSKFKHQNGLASNDQYDHEQTVDPLRN